MPSDLGNNVEKWWFFCGDTQGGIKKDIRQARKMQRPKCLSSIPPKYEVSDGFRCLDVRNSHPALNL